MSCRQALQRLTEAAEKAKIELSALPQTSINLPFITATADGPKHIDTTVSKAQFEKLCSDLLERVRRPVEQSLRDAKLDIKDIAGGYLLYCFVVICCQRQRPLCPLSSKWSFAGLSFWQRIAFSSVLLSSVTKFRKV
jgi:hypothetical protein